MGLKVLYVSGCHPVLESDDLSMLTSFNMDWFSTGIYIDPPLPVQLPHLSLRGNLTGNVDQKLLSQFYSSNKNYSKGYVGLNVPTPRLTKEFVNNFDIVMIIHIKAMMDNWEDIKHKPIILKTCGNTFNTEAQLTNYAKKGNVTFVRGSKNEFKILNSNGGRVIRITADPDIYSGWTGEDSCLLSFHSHFKQRRNLAPIRSYLKFSSKFNTRVYGAYAAGYKDPLVISTLSWEDQIKEYKKCSAYFGISSGRAPITYNFIEAFMTGIPFITFGQQIGSSESVQQGFPALYEIPEIIENGVDGFYSDNTDELRDFLQEVMRNNNLAKNLSKNARKKALKLFSPKTVREDWRQLYSDIGFSV